MSMVNLWVLKILCLSKHRENFLTMIYDTISDKRKKLLFVLDLLTSQEKLRNSSQETYPLHNGTVSSNFCW